MGRGLIVRLAVLLTAAMFPLGAIALWQTQRIADNAESLAMAAVLAETERAATAERKLLRRALGAAQGLSVSMIDLRRDLPACNALLRRFVESQDTFVFAGFIDTSGMMECASNGRVVDFRDHASFKRAMERQRPLFEVNRRGVATGQSVVIVSNPVRDETGVLLGFVSLSVPHSLTNNLAQRDVVGDGEYLTVNADGVVLSATVELDEAEALLPADLDAETLPMLSGRTFLGTGNDGQTRLFAVGTMIEDDVVVLGSHPANRVAGIANHPAVWLSMAFSVLMWMAGLLVAFLGMHRLVIRHLDKMRMAMRRFTAGERNLPETELEDPPTEIAALRESFNKMAEVITRAEAQREEDLTIKTVLLREVHHRVKNNLQLIASIMNMHGRTAQSPESRRLLTQLQRRVRGLATVHQTLSASAQMTYVNSRELFESLLRELGPTMPVGGQSVAVSSDIATVRMNADQAVTLSMLAAEALTNAVKHVGVPPGGRPEIRVELKLRAENRVHLLIENSRGESDIDVDEDFPSSGLGHRLMDAFVSQLDGRQETVETERSYIYKMNFSLGDVDGDDPSGWRTAPPAPKRVVPAE